MPTRPVPTAVPPLEPIAERAVNIAAVGAAAELDTASMPAPGKGGPKHRYIQALIKELAGQQGLKATIEAPLPDGSGQVDVLLERDGVATAIEVSVTTPAEHESENLRKCLAADYRNIAVVLAKSKRTLAHYRDVLLDAVPPPDRSRVTFLTPEELPAYIAALAPPPNATETVVKGYRVRVSHAQSTPEEARARQETLARVIARSVARQKECGN